MSCKKEDKSPFGSPVKFNLTVPLNYDYFTEIDSFAKKINAPVDSRMTSVNFSNATNGLIPGKNYKIKIFPILEETSFEDCVIFLRKQNAIMVGAPGLILALYLRKSEFPTDIAVFSFDEISALWKDNNGFPNIPGAQIKSHTDRYGYDVRFDFKPYYKEDFLEPGQALLCFTNK